MEANGKKPSSSAMISSAAIAVLVVAATLYVLSAPLAFRLTYVDGVIESATYNTTYAPILWLANSDSSPVNNCVTVYLFLCVPPNERVDGGPVLFPRS